MDSSERNLLKKHRIFQVVKQEPEAQFSLVFEPPETLEILEINESCSRNDSRGDFEETNTGTENLSHKNLNIVFKCNNCTFKSDDKNIVEAHKKTCKKNNHNKFQCNFCGKKFLTKRRLQVHQVVHMDKDKEKFECDICGAKIHNQNYLLQHKGKNVCIKKAMKKVMIKSLMNRNSSAESVDKDKSQNYVKLVYKPSKCNEITTEKVESFPHIQEPSKANENSSEQSEQASEEVFVKLIYKPIRKSTERSPPCEEAEVIERINNFSGTELKEDKQESENFVKLIYKPFKPEIITNKSETSSKFKRSRLSRNASLLFKCDLCPKEYKSKHTLADHIAGNHIKDFWFFCEFCGMKFKTRGKLTDHDLKDHQIKKHECSTCGKKFHSLSKLESHQSAHRIVGEDNPSKRYKCDFCDKYYIWKASLYRHKRKTKLKLCHQKRPPKNHS